MISPRAISDPCPIAAMPAEVLMVTFDCLNLKDVYLARFVCKEFQAHAQRAVATRKQQALQNGQPRSRCLRSRCLNPFKTALSEANFFYEKATKPTGLWCRRCLRVKAEEDFSDDQRTRAHFRYGRHCWKCTDPGKVFVLGGVCFFACSVPDCNEPILSNSAHWTKLPAVLGIGASYRKVCVACWPTYRKTLSARVRAKYGYYHRESDPPISCTMQ